MSVPAATWMMLSNLTSRGKGHSLSVSRWGWPKAPQTPSPHEKTFKVLDSDIFNKFQSVLNWQLK